MKSIQQILKEHGIEVWNNYAVECYTRDGIPGESFINITDFSNSLSVYAWLGY